jgi:hypothetical protein
MHARKSGLVQFEYNSPLIENEDFQLQLSLRRPKILRLESMAYVRYFSPRM